ncbi:unnamed protein product [Rotaria socialis]|uniref:Serine-threonine/tyrosine-protein kinase catalytic domain-containing protein n=1 Tax=Rotaria socialis TaxID=392032 RepID=A0A818HY34_9BILA|nr:unnamed protein product [Rotaria socialis]
MGVLMWQACSQGAIPFAGDTNSGDTRRRASINRRLGRPKQCQENLWAVISDCLLNEPELRFEFSAIKKRLSDLQDIRPPPPPPPLIRCIHCNNEFPQDQVDDHEVCIRILIS